ncbi:ATP-binding cassette domain-containing protein [Lacinutrix jangbogonensis]|uniref:ATP-binding cassette domain-containing protein n=1 Tax=Lacinutrix jangbogonensis TaxID=1469557 RepID=UPI00053E2BDC|nr:ATP-binding cassette domain-containing protein [Lacinutrix jangbogonensis]
MEYIIQTKNLTYSYSKHKKALDNLNINVPKGSIYGFLGPKGAGKSTTMQLLTSTLVNSQGVIDVFGESLFKQVPYVFSKIGSLVESPNLYLHLSAIDNLRCIAKLKEVAESKISEVLELVGLLENGNQKVKQFSLGMKQRLAIAMTLLGDPELLLLDEPVNGLDPSGITYIRKLLIKLNKEKGITIFISSHLLSEIEKMCTHIGIIHKGQLQYEGTMENLSKKAESCSVRVFSKNVKTYENTLKKFNKTIAIIDDEHFIVQLKDREMVPELSKFLIHQNIPLYELKIEDKLEDKFLSLTK